MSSTANRVIKNTGYLYIKMGITMFVSLYTTRLILNGLGASDFGIFNIVGGAIAMLGFLNAAMANATQRFMSYAEGEGNKEKQKSIFNISIILHAAIAGIMGIMLTGAGWFFFHGILTIPETRIFAAEVIYASLIVSTMFTVMSVPYDAAINTHENMRYYALIGILESALKLVIAFVCVYTTGDKLILYGILMAALYILTPSIMRVYCHKHYDECVFKPQVYFSKSLMKEMTRFAGWAFLTSISSMLCQYGLGIVINHFWGVLLNAAQGIANQVSGMLLQFSQNMMKAVNPILVKSEGAQNRERTIYITLFGCRVSTWIMMMFEIPMIILAPYILKLWLKNVPEWAVLFTQLQLARSIIEQLFSSIFGLVYANGNIKNYAIVKSALNFLPLLIVPILFSIGYSPIWLYVVWIICWGLFGGIVGLHYANKLADLQPQKFCKNVLIPCFSVAFISCIPYFGSCHLTNNDTIIIATGLICPLLIVISGWYIILQNTEKEKITSLIVSIAKGKKNAQ